jgi:ferredoxin
MRGPGLEGNDMKVSVDFDVCASTGSCVQVCPEVFEVRSDGYLYILQENPGEELRAKVEQAADLCPTAAITVEG